MFGFQLAAWDDVIPTFDLNPWPIFNVPEQENARISLGPIFASSRVEATVRDENVILMCENGVGE
jgi:hypothetical protein